MRLFNKYMMADDNMSWTQVRKSDANKKMFQYNNIIYTKFE